MRKRTIIAMAAALGLASVAAAHGAPRIGARLLLAPASYLGIGSMDISDEAAREIGLVDPHGVEVSSVADGSPADEAGLQRGDIIVAYRGERVNSSEHLSRLVRETPAGRSVELEIVRDGRREAVEVQVGSRKQWTSDRTRFEWRWGRRSDGPGPESDGAPWPWAGLDELEIGEKGFDIHFDARAKVSISVTDHRLGFDLESLQGQLAEHFGVERGVLVRSVAEGRPAAEAGLQAGDVIVAVDGKSVFNPGRAASRMTSGESDSVTLDIVRERREMQIELRH